MGKRGFTLIELLVVVAIIGILAAIVLSSLGSARAKANDVSVKSMLTSVRAAAEEYYIANNTYDQNGGQNGNCTAATGGALMWGDTTTNMLSLLNEIKSKAGGVGFQFVDCGVGLTRWSVAVKLSDGTFWCIDNSGKSTDVSSVTGVQYTSLKNAGGSSAHSSSGATTCS